MRFTAVMGPLSTLFDVVTFALLLGIFQVDMAQFRSAWFAESMTTQILVVLIIRTAGPVWQHRPHPALLLSTIGCLCVALALPWLPWSDKLGFAPIPNSVFLTIIGLVMVYLLLAEGMKRFALPRTER